VKKVASAVFDGSGGEPLASLADVPPVTDRYPHYLY